MNRTEVEPTAKVRAIGKHGGPSYSGNDNFTCEGGACTDSLWRADHTHSGRAPKYSSLRAHPDLK